MLQRWRQSQSAQWWLGVVAAVGLVAHLRAVVPEVWRPSPPTLVNTALYEHAGWYLIRGGRLYLDILEPKPPSPYETTAILSLIARGDPYHQHLLAVAVSTAASVATMVVLAALAGELTGRRDAGLVAGITPLLLPAYITVPAFGFSPNTSWSSPVSSLFCSPGAIARSRVGSWGRAVSGSGTLPSPDPRSRSGSCCAGATHDA